MSVWISLLFIWYECSSVCNSIIIQIRHKAILGSEAGVCEEAFLTIPFFEAAVVEQLQIVLDNEGDDIVLQALFKENQAACTAISVLEGMYAFKSYMEGCPECMPEPYFIWRSCICSLQMA